MADYLKRQNPKLRGFGRRHLYNMVKFYDMYSSDEFTNITKELKLPEIVQSEIAQLGNSHEPKEIVQLRIAQLGMTSCQMPGILAIVTFTSHLEIMNRCRTYEERIFYMLYACHQRLKTEELRRCIVNQTYSVPADVHSSPVF